MNERSLTPLRELYFLHADGDSFFAACELSVHPEYRGKPVVVGEDRGIAVAMSYEAKKLGIHRGMPIFKIRKYFPHVIILMHHFELYRTISNKMFAILLSYLDEVEQYSIDECFAVVKPSDIRFYGEPRALVAAIKKEVQDTLGVTYSFGFGRTKALAKQASKLQKPDGLVTLLTEADECAALQKTSIKDVWGIGWRTVPRLVNMGIQTAYDFIQLPDEEIERHFSTSHLVLKHELCGHAIYAVAADGDPRDQKSIQSTATFRPASADAKIIWAEMSENAEGACTHARKLRLVSNMASFFVKTSEFRYHFDEVKLPLFTADPGMVLNAIEPHFAPLLVPGERIRSTGVILHNLRREEDVQRDLFGVQETAMGNLAVELVADILRKKYGHDAVKRLASLKSTEHEADSSFRGVE